MGIQELDQERKGFSVTPDSGCLAARSVTPKLLTALALPVYLTIT